MNLKDIVNATYTEKATKEVAKYWLQQVNEEMTLNDYKIVAMVCGDSIDDAVTFDLEEVNSLRLRHHSLQKLRTRLIKEPHAVSAYEIALVLGNTNGVINEESVHIMSVEIAKKNLPNAHINPTPFPTGGPWGGAVQCGTANVNIQDYKPLSGSLRVEGTIFK